MTSGGRHYEQPNPLGPVSLGPIGVEWVGRLKEAIHAADEAMIRDAPMGFCMIGFDDLLLLAIGTAYLHDHLDAKIRKKDERNGNGDYPLTPLD
jgi:hypothetical protein